ncbi:MAG: hypothetical protein ABIZ80_02285 [Bryobacteraceae bacterium]
MFQRLLSFLFALLCLTGIWRTARLALADYYARGSGTTSEQIQQAIKLEPGDATYVYQRAVLDERAGPISGQLLQRALFLNPRFTRARLELAIRKESEGDFAGAEANLLDAAAADRTWAPRWALANYFLRRSNLAGFWQWIRLAAAVPYSDPDLIFPLCWRVSDNAAEILERAIPPVAEIRKRYLAYLLAESRLSGAESLVSEFLSDATDSDRDLLLRYCDRMLEEKRADTAVRVWNAMAGRGVLPYPALAASAGMSLTNGDLSSEPLSRGFDWRIAEVGEISSAYFGARRELRIAFSGRQPESCEVLRQYLPVEPGKQYTLRIRYRTERLTGKTGLHWRAYNALGGELPGESALPASEDGTEAALSFLPPAGCSLAILKLNYGRPLGSTRAEGDLVLRNMVLDRRPP